MKSENNVNNNLILTDKIQKKKKLNIKKISTKKKTSHSCKGCRRIQIFKNKKLSP
jgi:hypothetical protein